MSQDMVNIDESFSYVSSGARIAIYDDMLSAPRIVDIEPAPIIDFIESIASTTYEHAQKKGGVLPYTVIREIAENFIHAYFKECTVSILNNGNTIHFSDQGPGIEKKYLVQQPGVSSAVSDMKKYIRGVGSGFPIVKEYLEIKQGRLTIDDNAKGGVIITLSVDVGNSSTTYGAHTSNNLTAFGPQNNGVPGSNAAAFAGGDASLGLGGQHKKHLSSDSGQASAPQVTPQYKSFTLDKRAVEALSLFYKQGILGPSDFIKPLQVSVATAHRILVELEKHGLIEVAPNRKRVLSSFGASYYESLSQN